MKIGRLKVISAIYDRRSIRKFLTKPIADEDIIDEFSQRFLRQNDSMGPSRWLNMQKSLVTEHSP